MQGWAPGEVRGRGWTSHGERCLTPRGAGSGRLGVWEWGQSSENPGNQAEEFGHNRQRGSLEASLKIELRAPGWLLQLRGQLWISAQGHGIEPRVGLHTGGATCLRFSLSLSLWQSLTPTFSLKKKTELRKEGLRGTVWSTVLRTCFLSHPDSPLRECSPQGG